MSNILLEKAYNCFIVYLDRLSYGKVNQSYCLLYDAILAIANNIQEPQYIQYFENNLDCINMYYLNITDSMNRKILWTLHDSDILLNSFSWNEIDAPINDTYQFTTNSKISFNYLYVSIPQGVNSMIFNELNVQIFDSLVGPNATNQLFSLVGTMTLPNGSVNNVYRKNDVYNTYNPVLFKVKIY